MYTEFEGWFADCIIYCSKNYVGPDDYVWDITNNDVWRGKFAAGMTAEDAVKSFFEAH
jgi:hypothetical protein